MKKIYNIFYRICQKQKNYAELSNPRGFILFLRLLPVYIVEVFLALLYLPHYLLNKPHYGFQQVSARERSGTFLTSYSTYLKYQRVATGLMTSTLAIIGIGFIFIIFTYSPILKAGTIAIKQDIPEGFHIVAQNTIRRFNDDGSITDRFYTGNKFYQDQKKVWKTVDSLLQVQKNDKGVLTFNINDEPLKLIPAYIINGESKIRDQIYGSIIETDNFSVSVNNIGSGYKWTHEFIKPDQVEAIEFLIRTENHSVSKHTDTSLLIDELLIMDFADLVDKGYQIDLTLEKLKITNLHEGLNILDPTDTFYSSAGADGNISCTEDPTCTYSAVSSGTISSISEGNSAPLTVHTRSYLSFDTSGLDDLASISAADVNVYADSYSKSKTEDTTYSVNYRSGVNSIGATLDATSADYNCCAATNHGNLDWANTTGWKSKALTNPDGTVNKTGDTDFRLSANWTPASGNSKTAKMRQTEYSGTSSDPYLDVTYTVVSPIIVSGKVYTNEGTTAYDCSSDNLTIKVSVNGEAADTDTCTGSDGSYSVTVSVNPGAGQPVVAYIGSAETPQATTVTLALNSSTNITNLDLYQNTVIVRHESSGPIDSTDLNNVDNSDAGIRYSTSGSNLTTDSGMELHVWTGDTYDPGGKIETNTTGGDFHVDDNATAYFDTSTNDIGLDINVDTGATLDISKGTTVYGGDIITSGTGSITDSGVYTVQIQGSGTIGGGTGSIAFHMLDLGYLSTGTTTFSSDVDINTQIDVPTGHIASLDSGKVLTIGTQASFSDLAGTLQGDGRLDYKRANTFPTGGTVNVDVRFDATSGGPTLGARTYGGDVEIYNNSTTNGRSIGMASGTYTFSSNLTLNAANSQNITLTGETNDPTVNLTGDLDFTGVGSGSENLLPGAGTWSVQSNVDLTGGSFTAETNHTLKFNSSSGTSLLTTNSSSLYNLIIDDNGGSLTVELQDPLDVDNDLTITGGKLDVNSTGNYQVNIGGAFDNDDMFDDRNGLVIFDATSGSHNLDIIGNINYSSFYNLTFNDSGGGASWTNNVNFNITGDFTLTSGTLNDGYGMNLTGNYTNSGSHNATAGITTFNNSSGTITIDSTNAINLNFYNVVFSNAGTKLLKSDMVVSNNLSIFGGTLDIDNTGNYDIYVEGTWSNTGGTFEPRQGKVIFNKSAAAGKSSIILLVGTNDFYDLDVNTHSTSKVEMASGSGSLTVTNDFNIVSGEFDLNAWTLTIGGSFNNDATFTHNNGSVNFNASSGTKTIDADGTGTDSFNDITFNDGGGTAVWQLTGDMDVDNDFTITSGEINGNSQTISVGGSWSNSGTFTHGNGSVVFDSADVGETIDNAGDKFYNLTFNNASGGWTIQTSNVTTVNDFALTAGTVFTLENGRTLEVQGDFTQGIPGTNTTWTGTILYLNGSGALYNINASTHTGDTYAFLRIGATDSVAVYNMNATTLTIDSGACFYSQDHNGTDGLLHIYGPCNSRTNEYWSYATDFDGASLSGGSERLVNVKFEPSASFTVDNGDTLAIIGNASNRTLIDRQSTGNYGLNINGTINAQYFDIDSINSSGLNISSSATITELANGSFDNIGFGASASYITVSGLTSTDSFANMIFDTNTDGADANAVYNVNADGPGISWSFQQASGNKAGESFDREVNGAVVAWSTIFTAVNDGSGNDIDYTNDTSKLSVNWTTSSDTDVDHFEYAIGTTSGGTDVVGFTNTGVIKNITNTSITLTNNITYYATVRAYNTADDVLDFLTSDGLTIDTVAATFSNISVSVATYSIIIIWESSEKTTSQVRYGLTSSYGSETTEDTELVTSHSVAITGLAALTTYHFQVSGTDRAGNLTDSGDNSVTTLELEATVITNVQVTELTLTSTKITWTTNHPADSRVRYGLTTDYGSEVYDSTLVTSHEIIITGLEPGTQYHYEILSTGNTTAIDADATFSTLVYVASPTIVFPENGAVIDTTRFTITGLSRSNNTIFIFLDGELENTVLSTNHSSGTGSFFYKLKRDLSPGEHTLYTISRDSNGVYSERSPKITFTVDLPFITPTLFDPLFSDGENPRVFIRGVAWNDSLIKVYLDNEYLAEFQVINSETHNTTSFFYEISLADLEAGDHTVYVKAFDKNNKASRNSNQIKFNIGSVSTLPKVKTYQFEDSVDYIVGAGDTLWKISEKFYGQGGDYQKIVEANKERYPSLVTNPNLIRIGWELFIL